MTERIYLERHILQGNNEYAGQNRERLQQSGVLTLNLLSSPGAGKTTLLENLIATIKNDVELAVIEGDVATTIDSERIAAHGVPAYQINTHGACHLDARMIGQVLEQIELDGLDLLIIENVGNLVCPADFDLGEDLRIVLLSTTEGVDKVMKYPVVFRRADAVVLTKVDLLPYVPFDLETFKADVHALNPDVPIFPVAALQEQGTKEWIEWLVSKIARQ